LPNALNLRNFETLTTAHLGHVRDVSEELSLKSGRILEGWREGRPFDDDDCFVPASKLTTQGFEFFHVHIKLP